MSHIPELDGLRPTWIEVDLDALEANAAEACRRAGPSQPVLAVVKADGYAHGVVSTSRAFARGGVTSFAVALLEEALELREGGIDAPLLILGPLLPGQLRPALDAGATVSVYDIAIAKALNAEGARRKRRLPYHLKIDTGMGRLGVPLTALGKFLDDVRGMAHLRMEGLFTHLACADDPAASLTERQVDAFRRTVDSVRQAGHEPTHVHLANSAALMRGFPEFCTLVRPGIALYGYSPNPSRIPSQGFVPALSVRSRVVQVKRVPAGTPVGYGSTWTAGRDSIIATLPLGYEDGYPRSLGNRAHALVQGRRAPVVGRVSMDLTTLDVTGLPEVQVGDCVTFMGRDGEQRVDAWDLASWSGTIAWEVLCGLGRRVPRLQQRGGRVVNVRGALAGPPAPPASQPIES